jgi:hypothetical protein
MLRKTSYVRIPDASSVIVSMQAMAVTLPNALVFPLAMAIKQSQSMPIPINSLLQNQ